MSAVTPPDEHPFFFRRYGVHLTYLMTVDERVARIRQMGAEDLEKVLRLTGLQKTVRDAATRRLRKLRGTP
jgi:hypothetical protein